MVTDKERDYLWKFYAADKRARINLGIRRRLAPLLDNDRRKIELLNSLLLVHARHAVPVLRRRDRNGRQHLSRRPRRCAHADAMVGRSQRRLLAACRSPAKLFLPTIQDPIYGYLRRSTSRRNSRARTSPAELAPPYDHRAQIAASAMGRGTLASFLYPKNRKVLVYLRELDDRHHSLRRQRVERTAGGRSSIISELQRHRSDRTDGRDLEFPRIGELPYLLTLPAYGFYWFKIGEGRRRGRQDLAGLRSRRNSSPLSLRVSSRIICSPAANSSMPSRQTAAPSYSFRRKRWFAAKGTPLPAKWPCDDFAVLREGTRMGATCCRCMSVALSGVGEEQIYFTPLAADFESRTRTEAVLTPFAVAQAPSRGSYGLAL